MLCGNMCHQHPWSFPARNSACHFMNVCTSVKAHTIAHYFCYTHGLTTGQIYTAQNVQKKMNTESTPARKKSVAEQKQTRIVHKITVFSSNKHAITSLV